MCRLRECACDIVSTMPEVILPLVSLLFATAAIFYGLAIE
jgi:hypothetical protein